MICSKYGEEKFALGCEIVARWVNGSVKHNTWSAEVVLNMCNDTQGQCPIYSNEAEVLRRLFGLQSVEELFT